MTRRVPTTKDIGLLKQLHDQGQLILAAESQRNSVWPRSAKAYLIDTIINDRPIPLLLFQRAGRIATRIAMIGKPMGERDAEPRTCSEADQGAVE